MYVKYNSDSSNVSSRSITPTEHETFLTESRSTCATTMKTPDLVDDEAKPVIQTAVQSIEDIESIE